MPIVPFKGTTPIVHDSAFIAPDAWITGETTIGEQVSVLFGASLRGDILPISVGARSNIQEHAILHTSHGLTPCIVGAGVTIGHQAIVHGCTIEDNCIIGMGSVVLDGAVVEENCIIGAQAVVPMNAVIPAGSLVVGVPGKVVRQLSENDIADIKASAASYVETGAVYKDQLS